MKSFSKLFSKLFSKSVHTPSFMMEWVILHDVHANYFSLLERKLRHGPSPTTAVITTQVAPVQAPSAEAVDMVDSTGWFYNLTTSFTWYSSYPDQFLLLGCSDFHGIA